VQGAIQEVYDEIASDSLRDDLASTDVGKGASLVAYNTNQNVKQALDSRAEIIECVHDLVGKIGKEGQVVQTQAYWPGWAATLGGIPVGGAAYIWDSSLERTKHNGGCFISPTVPWDGAENTFADFIAGTGESSPSSNGCWV